MTAADVRQTVALGAILILAAASIYIEWRKVREIRELSADLTASRRSTLVAVPVNQAVEA